MGSRTVNRNSHEPPLWQDVQAHRTREQQQRYTRTNGSSTYWNESVRAFNTWDGPGLAMWLVECVPVGRRPTLGEIVDALWG